MASQFDAKAVGDGVDRLLELFVGERVDGAGLFVDEVVVMVVGVGDLVACVRRGGGPGRARTVPR